MIAPRTASWPRTACLVFCLGFGVAIAGSKPAGDTTDSAPPKGSFTHHYKQVHAFSGADGEFPRGELLLASDGHLYGTTWTGGGQGHGVVYRMDRSGGGFAVLHSFDDLAFGANPSAGLIEASDGNFYGTTSNGGVHGVGVIFRMA